MKSNVSAAGKFIRVAGVESLVDVQGETGDAEFLANVAAVPLPAHRIETEAGFEIDQANP